MDKFYLYAPKVSSKRQCVKAEDLKFVDDESYTSLFHFDSQMKEYLEKNPSVSGYNGKIYGEYFVLDLDGDNIDELVKDATSFLTVINNIPHFLWWSGNKGFHVYIPKIFVKYDAAKWDHKWNIASRIFAEGVSERFPALSKYVDLSVYDNVRIFRMPYSIHPKSGKRKELIQFNGYDSTIKALANFTALNFAKEEVLSNIFVGKDFSNEDEVYLMDIDAQTKKKATSTTSTIPSNIGKKDFANYVHGERLCIADMMNATQLKGSRHVVALRLQSHWKSKGFNNEMVEAMLNTWNNGLENKLSKFEMSNITKYMDKGYIFTCKDPVLSKFCKKSCYLYKSKALSDDFIYRGSDYAERYLAELSASQENWIYMNQFIPYWNLSPIKPTHVVVLAAGSGVGKTTIMLNIMNHYKHLHWLFFSLEMTGVDITEKMALIKDYDLTKKEEIGQFTESMEHITTIDKASINVDEIKDYINMVNSYGKRVNAIVIDFLSQLSSIGNSQTERAIHIANKLKEVAKEMKITIFVLSQVPKGVAGEGNVWIGKEAPKDSGEITNLCDYLITAWRPDIMRPDEDDSMIAYVAKNRHGVASYQTNLQFQGNRYLISAKKGVNDD